MEIVKITSTELGEKDQAVRTKNQVLARKLGTVGYSEEKSDRFKLTTFIHKYLSRFVDKRTYEYNYKRKIKFSVGEVEMHDGNVVKNTEYEQHYARVTCHTKPFTILGVEFKLKYHVDVESFRQLTIVPRFKTPLVKQENSVKRYHIKNTEVTKEEYEAYKSNK